MLGVEGFTILAILEAQDRISAIMEHIDSVTDTFGETVARVAGIAGSAGETIDESLLQTASGADAVVLANAKVEASAAAVATAREQQATAEKALLEVQRQVSAGELDEAEVADTLSAALKTVTDANAAVTEASKAATSAQADQAAVMAAVASAARKEAEAEGVAITTQDDLAKKSAAAAAGTKSLSSGMTIAALAVGAAGYASVKAAANFQDATTHLVTDAGEQKNALLTAQQGILSVSAATGTSANDLVNAMYHIDSAGYHVANGGLKVLTIAAEGAKVGGADLDTVSKTLVGTMNALGVSGGSAASVMNQLIATVGAGDMRMQDLASSISTVVPLGAAAHLSFAQMGGAIATMTAQGMSADQASQDLANTIRALSAPTQKQISEMQQLGLNSTQVQMDLGKQGLTGTINELTSAIAAHMKGGQVFINTLKSSQAAANDANVALKQLPAGLQKLGQGLLNGSVTAKQWTAAIKNLGVPQKELATQFEALVKKTGQFNSLITSGSPAAQTFNQALEGVMGNATAMNTALLISGNRMASFQQNVATISEAAKKGGDSVDNWATIQGTLNQKMDVMKSSVEAVGISIGTMLLPFVSRIMGDLGKFATQIAGFISHNQTLVGLFMSMAGAVLAVVLAMKTWVMITKAWAAAQLAINTLFGIFDAEVDANPIGIIVLAIAALVGGLIYAYNHFKTFRDVVHDVFDFLKTATTDTIGFVEGHWREIISIIGGPLGVTVALVTKYWRQIYNGFMDAWHGLDTAFHAVVTAVETVWHTVVTIWNTIWSVTETIWNAISGFFAKWWPLLLVLFAPFIALIVGLWNWFHQDVFNVAKAIWNSIMVFLKIVWGLILDYAKYVFAIIKLVIIQPIEAIWDTIKIIWNAVKPYLVDIWNGIKAVASTIWQGIKTVIVQPIEDAWNAITSWVGKIATGIKTSFDQVKTNLTKMWDDWVNIGENIVKGIISGVTSKIGDAVKSIEGVGNSMLNGAKHLLHIGSPSQLFADEVGQWIPAGIGVGITNNTGAVKTALQDLSKKMPGMVKGSSGLTNNLAAGLIGTGNLASTGSYGGGGVIINLDLRNSQVMSDNDMKLLANRVGRVIATQMLPQAGVRIRS